MNWLAVILYVCIASSFHAVDFYVDIETGSDLNPGTEALPFATIEQAKIGVRTLVSQGLQEAVNVYIKNGTYHIEEPLIFSILDSGTSDHSINYRAYPGHHPVISGGREINGFTENPNGTWSSNIPEVISESWTFRELFVNGIRRPRARHPGTGYNQVSFAASNQRTTFEFYEGDLPVSTNLAGAELVFFHDWSISRVGISGVNHQTNVLTTTYNIGPASAIFGITFFEDHPRYYIENHESLLDSPGEWHLDENTGELTYYPFPHEVIGDTEFVAPVSEQLIIVRGIFDTATTSPQYVRNIHFDGMHLSHSSWSLPVGGFAEYQAGFYEPRDGTPFYDLPAAVVFEQAEACSFENGSVTKSGGWGIMAGRTTRFCKITGNHVSDIAGTGVIVGEDQFRNLRNINDIAIGQWWILDPGQAANNNIVSNNLIEKCGRAFFGCPGIWVGITHNNQINSNIVRETSWSGISIGGFFDDSVTPCHTNTISHNHIHDVVEVMSDGGGIYTLGRQTNTVISNNIIHDIPLQPGVSSNVGIFLDQASTDILINDNSIFNIVRPPCKAHLIGENTLSNNRIVRSSSGIPYILYINASADQLTLNGNSFNTSNEIQMCDHFVFENGNNAGLQPDYRNLLLPSVAEDGCSSCEDSYYTGFMMDDCGVCEGGNVVDPFEYSGFQSCMSGPAVMFTDPCCQNYDFNDDSVIDLRDFVQFTLQDSD